MAIPHIVIGLVFAFFGAEQVQLIETQLQTRLPAGFDIAAFVLTVLLWAGDALRRQRVRRLSRESAGAVCEYSHRGVPPVGS